MTAFKPDVVRQLRLRSYAETLKANIGVVISSNPSKGNLTEEHVDGLMNYLNAVSHTESRREVWGSISSEFTQLLNYAHSGYESVCHSFQSYLNVGFRKYIEKIQKEDRNDCI